ncbi:hypothetical protein DKM44_00210 [Deinococcus irradiatisoli]|uniref:Uncharacterized protein n=1 Tax=Deinococcus irradiatisoli TaxID=2202254 RepID=A0A2Z3JEG0_9DEIO|nr:hypothetical protein [Deinococcus irradiatisoli]AWN21851.1 hypothetical protein DKM44_00210 [Deinococcus irradiatisoli]
MRKTLLTVLTLTAALSFVPASFASAAPIAESPMSAAAYAPLYTESSWMTLRVPLAELGGRIPSDLALSTSGLPDGTSITLLGAAEDGSDAVLTVSVQRSDLATAVNANSLVKLTSGDTLLTSFNVPVVGVAYGD